MEDFKIKDAVYGKMKSGDPMVKAELEDMKGNSFKASAFDAGIMKAVFENKGKVVGLTVEQSMDRKYNNIRGISTDEVINGKEEWQGEPKSEADKNYEHHMRVTGQEIKPKDFGKSKYEPTSMYVSYAKDIFIAGIDQEGFTMQMAIDLIKQAREAFS